MSNYIGNQPAFGEFKKLDSIVSLFNGSTTQFNLEHNSVGHTIGDATQLIVSLNGVVQEPGTAYTLGLGGGSIVFASAPASTDTCHIVALGGVGSTGTVADGSITAVKLASNLRDLLEEEFTGDGSATTFTMARSVSYSNQLLVTISGVVQPTSAYSVSGTTLTISPALPNATNIRILHIGLPGAFNSANSILPSMLSSTGGTANQVLAVNANATGIEFQTVSGGGSALTIQEEGSSLSTAATTLNFVGTAVTATGSGATKTITISGGGLSDVVSDTTPQLGGNLDTNSKNIAFGDSSGATVNRLTFGAGNDLVIYHDNSTNKSHITESGTSHLIVQGQEIQFKNASGTSLMALNSAQCELFFSGSKKMETNTSGITVTGTIDVNGAYTLPTTLGSAGQVLKVPSSGTLLEFAADSTSGGGSTGQTITTITANTTLSNSDKGKLIQTETSGITITIPALSSLDADWFVDIETLNTNTFNHGKVTLDITTNNSGASINRGGNETMYGASKIRLQRSPAGGDSQGQLSAFASNYLTGGIIVREDRLAGGLQGGDVGVGSIMLGNAQDASGNDAIAIGQLGSASATGSVAIGSYNGSSATTVAAATGAVAIGSGRAGGNQSLALQIQNSSTSYGASGANSIAIGYQAKATRDPSMALGHQSNASGTGSQAFGYMASATGNYSTAIGLGASANQSDQIAIGGTGKPVKIANRYTMPIADGTNGQVMATDGSGVISFADAPTEFGLPADQSFTVTNNGSGAYTFAGGATGDNATLTLIRGRTYKFSINASGHPFRINTSNTTGTGAAYVNGTAVINNGAAVGDIYFTVPDTAPDTLYYNCEYHSSMAGTINVSNVFVIDKTNNRIESDGSILVSDSSLALARRQNPAGWSEVGISLGGDTAGLLNANVTGNHHRLGREEDGKIVAFFKAGNDIGSIGVASSDNLYIGATSANHAGVYFGTNIVYPMTAGSISDASVNLGEPTAGRFKDAYLSGGVYLGGTGSANKLDDYEEGTWTPVDNNGNAYNNGAIATYTKIGRIVYINFDVNSTGSTGGGVISGLPFLASPSSVTGNWSVYGGYSTSNSDLWGHINQNSTSITMYVGSIGHVLNGRWIGAGFYYT